MEGGDEDIAIVFKAARVSDGSGSLVEARDEDVVVWDPDGIVTGRLGVEEGIVCEVGVIGWESSGSVRSEGWSWNGSGSGRGGGSGGGRSRGRRCGDAPGEFLPEVRGLVVGV